VAAIPDVEAGQLVVSGKRAYRVLGPPESKPMQVERNGVDVIVDRYSLPVEPIPPQVDPPSGGHWIDESCFDSLRRYALIANSIPAAEQKSEAQR
jgi:hypothetical protein